MLNEPSFKCTHIFQGFMNLRSTSINIKITVIGYVPSSSGDFGMVLKLRMALVYNSLSMKMNQRLSIAKLLVQLVFLESTIEFLRCFVDFMASRLSVLF